MFIRQSFSLPLLFCLLSSTASGADLKLLFMGDNGHHRPESRFQELAPALEQRGVQLKYTDRMEDLNADTLSDFDGLVLYANIDRIEDAQANAVLEFVANGKAFIPLHCATYCWRNNKDIVALMGAQFQRHGGQVFTTQIAEAGHPIMRGYGSFTSWDETYIHHLHNEKNRRVLEYRLEGDQAEGNDREPWTWVRTHGKGRVFYTAWGHDGRTFNNPGFHNLVERGIRWACKDDPSVVPAHGDPDRFVAIDMQKVPEDAAKFNYVDVGPKIPNYTPGNKWGVQGKAKTLMQKPLTPEEAITHITVPEGFSTQLYADEGDFGGNGKPIAMTWDERGRLWICETLDYPNGLGKNRDRIRICEDTDGDGTADKFTVFAEGLSIPTAIVVVRDGVIVQNGVETVFLKDTDGDDKADERRTLISGWALGDTHGGVSNFRYGLDNWIYGMQGYNNSQPKLHRPDGSVVETQSFRMGFFRFKLSRANPVYVEKLEFLRSSDNNTWGLGISEEGLIFGSTANHNPSMFVPIPNRYYEMVRGWGPDTLHSIADTYKFKPITENVRQVDQFGGYTAGAGHALYTARAFPSQFWNKTAFVCGPTGHLVGTFVLRRDGANYTSSSPMNLLASDDEWCAPIMAEVGPDGAVWVLDWYNYIVQHNPTPQGFKNGKGNAYESDLRDKRHGRIYRVVPGRSTAPTSLHAYASLRDAENATLIETLKHPSMMWRLHAQRLLIERRPDGVRAPLLALIADQGVDEAGLNVGAIHALHTLNGLGLWNELDKKFLAAGMMRAALDSAMKHAAAGVRRAALAVLPHNRVEHINLLNKYRHLFSDSDMQVRLQAILTLADMPPAPPESGVPGLASTLAVSEQIRACIAATSDPILLDALSAAAAAHLSDVPGFLAGADGDRSSEKHAKIARRIAEHCARANPSPEELARVLNSLENWDAVAINLAVLEGLNVGLPAKYSGETSTKLDDAFKKCLEFSRGPARVQLVRLAARCNSEVLLAEVKKITQQLADTVEDEDAAHPDRLTAANDLIEFSPEDPDAASTVLETINAAQSIDLSIGLLKAVAQSRADETGSRICEALPAFTPKVKAEGARLLLDRTPWAAALLDAFDAKELDIDLLPLDQKQALRSYPDKTIAERAAKVLAMSGGLPDANRDKVLKSLLPITDVTGDVENGLTMFKKHCAVCHKHGDLGKNIGPNLTGMVVHPKAELLTHIIDPSRSVEGNFRIYTVVDINGKVRNGMLAAETRTSLSLIDSEGKTTNLQRTDIEELVASRKSLMPEGFEKQMTESELSDLLEFLTNKGKYVPIPFDKYATAISTKGLFHSGDTGPDRMIFPDWKPKFFKDIPFVLTDPEGKSKPNIIMLHGPRGPVPPRMPKSVSLPCNTPAKAIHILGGVGGWSFPAHGAKSTSVTVRLHYEDGAEEDHPLINGQHFADYIRRVDVPKSEFVMMLRGQQVRHLSVSPKRAAKISTIELIKGDDPTAPMFAAITIER